MVPQIIYLVLIGSSLLLSANRHGKPKTGTENFWTTCIGLALSMALLYWGGFWAPLFG
jgi:LPXTG-motif cell wall-anchored protein